MPKSSQVRVLRFRTTADLESLLHQHMPTTDILIMAAAVADFRPRPDQVSSTKLRRTERGLTLELESTPDLLAGCARVRRPGQTLIGFALEPADTMTRSAGEKLTRKGVDMIVANALETMDAPTIDATVVGTSGVLARTPGTLSKEAFAPWLLDVIAAQAGAYRS
jgi:phosphopantothenoylcysteine decarboxylase/phosphopantothenate--cysteine ligase